LVGVPPLAGFFSKEAVVASLHEKPWLWIAALVGIAVTAWYCTRVLLLAFFGAVPEGVHPHEPAFAMRMPLVLLAIPAAGLGLSAYVVRNDLVHLNGELVLPLGLTAVGLTLGWVMCRSADPVPRLGRFGPFMAGGFGLDAVQRWLVVVPVVGIAKAVRFLDVSGVDGVVMGVGRATRSTGSALAAWHRAALPRAFAAVLGAAALLAVAGVTLSLVGLW
jgi:NADH-quinone oxidoreductase subunit L